MNCNTNGYYFWNRHRCSYVLWPPEGAEVIQTRAFNATNVNPDNNNSLWQLPVWVFQNKTPERIRILHMRVCHVVSMVLKGVIDTSYRDTFALKGWSYVEYSPASGVTGNTTARTVQASRASAAFIVSVILQVCSCFGAFVHWFCCSESHFPSCVKENKTASLLWSLAKSCHAS